MAVQGDGKEARDRMLGNSPSRSDKDSSRQVGEVIDHVMSAPPADRDFADRITPGETRKRVLRILIIVVVLAIIAVLIFLAKGITSSHTATQSTGQAAVSMHSLYPDAPQPNGKPTTTSVSGQRVTTSDGVVLSIDGAQLTGAQQQCIVTESTDLCLAGVGNFHGTEVYVYFFKDIVRSRFFDGGTNFTKVAVTGASASATVSVPVSSASPTSVIAVAGKDSTGFMVVPANPALAVSPTPASDGGQQATPQASVSGGVATGSLVSALSVS